ncbi:electron transfer flavoprotein subunit beta/FixA family protein [uncultured Clostridium sp.]|uniref:electron transfer flavoprotein subunit beta/FixA family protein n=1 Tax=uncultured Clostridium sp. TaxID=59620 RepID=UPI0026062D60|nr:electron transfer flavoprotein subunit beta/FixA family protein [uncultured Clostridium sp.]
MKILVCIKQVPADNNIEFDQKTGRIIRKNNEMRINPLDLYAIEEGLALKDRFGGEVLVMTMGPESSKDIIVEAISLGVDNGVILSDRRFAASDVLATSRTLKSGIEVLGDFDVVLSGRESVDGSTGILLGELGERLSIPTLHNVSEIIDIKNDVIEALTVEDENKVRIKVKLPVAMSVLDGANEPRFPDYVQLLRGENTEIKILTLDDFSDKDENHYGLSGSESIVTRVYKDEKENTIDFNVSSNKGSNEKWTGTAVELAGKLENKLKEIKFL